MKKDYRLFNYFNKNLKNIKKYPEAEFQILIEFHGWKVLHVIYALLANFFLKNTNYKILAYSSNNFLSQKNFFKKIIEDFKWYLGSFLKCKTFKLYSAFGTSDFIKVKSTSRFYLQSKHFLKKIYKTKINKSDILNLQYDNILIGDILYDSYLRLYNKPTLDPNNIEFIIFFQKFMESIFFWINYFEKNNVQIVIAAHATFFEGIPLRIAIFKNKKAFIANAEKIYFLNKKNIYPHTEYLFFKKNFSKLSKQQKNRAITIAKNKINQRFRGILGDMIYLTKTAYGEIKNNRVILKSKNKKIIIAAHSFCDAPHARGNGLFNDYYEWINFLFKLSKETNYDWYIKCHPNFHEYFDNTVSIIKADLKKYPNIKWIEPGASHKQIIKEGINLALTCDGSIGLEYAYFGIPVINASRNNYHINYNFNFHPVNIKDYKKLILNLNFLKKDIKRKEVLECYFMNYIFNDNTWFFEDIKKTINYVGGYKNLFNSDKIYNFFINFMGEKRIIRINQYLDTFLSKKDYLLNFNHMGRSINNVLEDNKN